MIKVFLVEDEKIIRKSIKNNVKWEENGFEFAGEAPDGEMALPMIEKLHPDIVITDIKMPFMDGLELSDILKKKMPKIQIIILSGYGEFDYAKEAIKIGVTDYLTKPVTGEQLLEALNKVKQKLDKKKRQEEDIKKLQKNIKTQMKNMSSVSCSWCCLSTTVNDNKFCHLKHFYSKRTHIVHIQIKCFRIGTYDCLENHKWSSLHRLY